MVIQKPFCPTLLAPKEMLQGGFGDFISMKLLRLQMALALMTTRECSRIMTKGSLQGILAICQELRLRTGIHWRCVGIDWIPELAQYPLETCRYPLVTGIWLRREIPANSILAAAFK
jgi:hypothetical protein